MKKDKTWAMNQINNLDGVRIKGRFADFTTIPKDKAIRIISDMDEPEVLSQGFIKDNQLMKIGPEEVVYYVPVENLQNLIVPKQELPVIPKFVAEWIEDLKSKKINLLENIYDFTHDEDINNYIREQGNALMRAWLDGYEVEEEPLYRARLKVITEEFIASYLCTQSSDAEDRLKALEIGSKYIHEDYRHLSEFTEDELKRLGIWDSRQWEVEELEE